MLWNKAGPAPAPAPLDRKTPYIAVGGGRGGRGVNAFYKPTTREIFIEKKDPVSRVRYATNWLDQLYLLPGLEKDFMYGCDQRGAASNHVSVY